MYQDSRAALSSNSGASSWAKALRIVEYSSSGMRHECLGTSVFIIFKPGLRLDPHD